MVPAKYFVVPSILKKSLSTVDTEPDGGGGGTADVVLVALIIDVTRTVAMQYLGPGPNNR